MIHKKHGLADPEKMKAEENKRRSPAQEQGTGEVKPENSPLLGGP